VSIAITATEPLLGAEVDPRFGRARYLIIVDPETMDFDALENPAVAVGGGAGVATAQMIAGKGVAAVLTGNCGPNAYEVLSAAGIKVITGVSGKVRDAVAAYQAGTLTAAAQANVTEHFGMGSGRGRGRGRQ
jgi:predicted Fe-Mo cluster-binding NifX family protein